MFVRRAVKGMGAREVSVFTIAALGGRSTVPVVHRPLSTTSMEKKYCSAMQTSLRPFSSYAQRPRPVNSWINLQPCVPYVYREYQERSVLTPVRRAPPATRMGTSTMKDSTVPTKVTRTKIVLAATTLYAVYVSPNHFVFFCEGVFE